MERYNRGAGAASAPSAPAAPANPFFTEGNPSLGVPATQPGPWWYHMVSEELRKVITDAGLTPDHTDLTQLSAAIQAMITASLAPDASETVKGIIEIATAAEAQAGIDNSRAITPAALNETVLGMGQNYSEVTGSRALSTNYTNTTGRPIFVSVSVKWTAGGMDISLLVNGNLASISGSTANSCFPMVCAVVPAGGVYRVNSTSGGILHKWVELS